MIHNNKFQTKICNYKNDLFQFIFSISSLIANDEIWDI